MQPTQTSIQYLTVRFHLAHKFQHLILKLKIRPRRWCSLRLLLWRLVCGRRLVGLLTRLSLIMHPWGQVTWSLSLPWEVWMISPTRVISIGVQIITQTWEGCIDLLMWNIKKKFPRVGQSFMWCNGSRTEWTWCVLCVHVSKIRRKTSHYQLSELPIDSIN
jgi:hypothetical protein